MTRLTRTWFIATALTAVCAALPAQENAPSLPYASTLTFGTGLINIPVAWVSPANGDVWFSLSSRAGSDNTFKIGELRQNRNSTFSIDAHLFGRVSLGGSIYSVAREQVGGFAQALLIREGPHTPRWLPSLAVGVRGIGVSPRQDRFVTGSTRVWTSLGNKAPGDGKINGDPTIYGVATKEFGSATTSLSVTVGAGNGFFRNDAGMDTLYNAHGTTGGLFGGLRASHALARGDVQLSAIVETDAWDVNAGVVAVIKHWQIGVLATELDEPGKPANRFAGWTKYNLLVGYNGSLPGIIRGTRMRAELTELDIEAQELRREVAQRERRRAALERELARAQKNADAASSKLQTALQKQLEAEREAIRKANERLDTVQKGVKPPEGR